MRAIFGRGAGDRVSETDALQVRDESEPITARERVSAMLRFMPNLVGLCGRLIADARVSKTDKALFASAILYALAPLDLMPDLLPFIGQVDDAYLIALTLLRMIDRADEGVVREHWRGDGDPVLLARSMAGLAPMLLPRRISRVLSAKIELAPLFKPAPRGREAAVLVDHNADDETKALLRTTPEDDWREEQEWEPIEVEGTPLSRIVIEGRGLK